MAGLTGMAGSVVEGLTPDGQRGLGRAVVAGMAAMTANSVVNHQPSKMLKKAAKVRENKADELDRQTRNQQAIKQQQADAKKQRHRDAMNAAKKRSQEAQAAYAQESL